MQIYSMRFTLKWLLAFFIVSCQSNLPAQEQLSELTEKNGEQSEKLIKVGAERIAEISSRLENKRVGVIANQTSRVGNTHLVDTLIDVNINVVRIFSPEHGFRGEADAGEKVNSNKDEKTGLEVVSLYGNNKKPTVEQLKGIDVLLFDLQDVGTRFYTYISTLHYAMEAAAENNVEVIVLDRPNPNGSYVDGPIRKNGFESFVGMDPIPVVHGMTVGEIGKMINGEGWLKGEVKCKLEVIACEQYGRTMPYSLPVSPSPNLRSDEAIQLYPTLCFFEGTIVSIGRGTVMPFEVFGHPDLKGKPGYDASFKPISSYGAKHPKLENEVCYGKNLQDYFKGSPADKLEISWIIDAYKDLGSKPTFFLKNNFFDLLAGTDELRKQIIAGKSEAEIRQSWETELVEFKKMRKKYLIYKDN